MAAAGGSTAGPGNLPFPRLLVVDDEAIFREELSSFLTEQGYPLKSASSAEEALGLLEREGFDVLLCDNKMPRRSGAELIAEVRSRWPSIFIVSVTGAASEQTTRRMLEDGPYHYLLKPFRLSQITRVLNIVRSELELRSRVAPGRSLDEVLDELLRDGLHVGILGTDLGTARMGISILPDDPTNPAGLPKSLEAFVRTTSNPSVVLLLADRWLRNRGHSKALEFVRWLRSRMEGVGPLVLGIERSVLSQREVLVLRETLSFPSVTFEGFGGSGRQRRALLRSLSTGPKREGQLQLALEPQEAEAGPYFLDDLVAHGLIERHSGLYRLTSDGEKEAQAIGELERSPSMASGGSRIFTLAG